MLANIIQDTNFTMSRLDECVVKSFRPVMVEKPLGKVHRVDIELILNGSGLGLKLNPF